MIPLADTLKILGLGLVLITFLVLSNEDYKDTQVEHEHRCYMMSMYLEDSFNRVPEMDRRGWNTTIEEYERVCNDN